MKVRLLVINLWEESWEGLGRCRSTQLFVSKEEADRYIEDLTDNKSTSACTRPEYAFEFLSARAPSQKRQTKRG